MSAIPQNTASLLFGFGPHMHALMAIVANLLGIGALLSGIVSGARKSPVGLSATNWFLLTIILFLWGLIFWLGAYFGAKEGYTG